MLEAFGAAFVLALLSEIADKTQLVIFGLALQFKSPWRVFFGALGAHAFMDGIAIALGTFFSFTIDLFFLKAAVGILFLALGFWQFVKLFVHRKSKKKSFGGAPFVASFLTVSLSEFGDKTQIASGLLAAKYALPVSIFIGTILALALAIGFNIFIGSKVAEKLPREAIKIITGLLFIAFGLFTLLA